jgi:hypothetical protein
MRTSEILRSAFRMASAVVLIALASIKQLPLMDTAGWAEWQCGPVVLAGFVRALVWVFSEQGRAIVGATLAILAALPFLRRYRQAEARELMVAILALLVFVFLASVSKESEHNHKICAQMGVSLAAHSSTKP